MGREISCATKRDFELLKLGQEVLKVVKTKKEWKEFKRYMEAYYKDYKSVSNFFDNKS